MIDANELATQEQAEQTWKSYFKLIGADKRGRGGIFECTKCGECHPIKLDFCPHCGRAMTPEAMEIVRKRLEEMNDGEND